MENSIPLSIFPISPNKFVFCFCGLPGRGKTHISRRLGRYLEFFHAVPVRVFNVAEYRQRLCGGLKDAEWFDLNNQEALALRTQCNQAAIRDMELFLSECDNGVAILDSTNPTHQRRVNLKTAVRAFPSSRVGMPRDYHVNLLFLCFIDAQHRGEGHVHRSAQRR